jgi:hypothetical protein
LRSFSLFTKSLITLFASFVIWILYNTAEQYFHWKYAVFNDDLKSYYGFIQDHNDKHNIDNITLAKQRINKIKGNNYIIVLDSDEHEDGLNIYIKELDINVGAGPIILAKGDYTLILTKEGYPMNSRNIKVKQDDSHYLTLLSYEDLAEIKIMLEERKSNDKNKMP